MSPTDSPVAENGLGGQLQLPWPAHSAAPSLSPSPPPPPAASSLQPFVAAPPAPAPPRPPPRQPDYTRRHILLSRVSVAGKATLQNQYLDVKATARRMVYRKKAFIVFDKPGTIATGQFAMPVAQGCWQLVKRGRLDGRDVHAWPVERFSQHSAAQRPLALQRRPASLTLAASGAAAARHQRAPAATAHMLLMMLCCIGHRFMVCATPHGDSVSPSFVPLELLADMEAHELHLTIHHPFVQSSESQGWPTIHRLAQQVNDVSLGIAEVCSSRRKSGIDVAAVTAEMEARRSSCIATNLTLRTG